MKCTSCGAALFEGADWCGLCGSTAARENADELLAEAAATSTRAPVLPRWQPEERYVSDPPPKLFSRLKGGDLSLGLGGKIAVSLLALVFWLWFLVYSGSPGSALALIAGLVVLFRDTWRRRRIR